MKNFSKKIIIFLVMLAVTLTAVALNQNDVNNAYADELPQYTFDDYTNSTQSISDASFDLNAYNTNYFGSFNSGFPYLGSPQQAYTIIGAEEDRIAEFVPRELFFTQGETLHIGKTYGFYVNCNLGAAQNYVTVMIFKINSVLTNSITNELKIENFFCYDYIVAKSPSYIGHYENNVLVATNCADFIYAKANADHTYSNNQKYMISNSSFFCMANNNAHKNQYDTGYVAADDYGSFLIGTLYAANGIYQKYSEPTQEEKSMYAYTIATNLLISAIGFTPFVGSVMSTIFSLGLETNNAAYLLETKSSSYANESIASENINFSYNTRNAQLANYNQLLKHAFVLDRNTINASNYGFLIPSGGFSSATFVFSQGQTQQNQDANWDTSLSYLVDLKIARLDEDQITYLDSSYFGDNYSNSVFTKDFRNTEESLQSENGTTNKNIYVLPNQENTYVFTPEASGAYTFNLGNIVDLTARVYLNDNAISSTNGSYILNGGQQYKVKIISASNSTVETFLNITPTTVALTNDSYQQDITLAPNGFYILKISDFDGKYLLLSSNEYIKIANISNTMPSCNNEVNSKQYFDILSGEKYILLYNSSLTEQSSTFSINAIQNLSAGLAIEQTVTIQPNSYAVIDLLGNGCLNIMSSNTNCQIKSVGVFAHSLVSAMSVQNYYYILNNEAFVWLYNNSDHVQTTTVTALEPTTTQHIAGIENQYLLSNINTERRTIFKVDTGNNASASYKLVVPQTAGASYDFQFYDASGNGIAMLSSTSISGGSVVFINLPSTFFVSILANFTQTPSSVQITLDKIEDVGEWYINGQPAVYVGNYVQLYKLTTYSIEYRLGNGIVLNNWTTGIGTNINGQMFIQYTQNVGFSVVQTIGGDNNYINILLNIEPIKKEYNISYVLNSSDWPSGSQHATTYKMEDLPMLLFNEANAPIHFGDAINKLTFVFFGTTVEIFLSNGGYSLPAYLYNLVAGEDADTVEAQKNITRTQSTIY